jgi:hypothetical protein
MSLDLVESLSIVRYIVARFNFLFNPGASASKNMMSGLIFIVDDLPDSTRKFPVSASHTEDETLTIFIFTCCASQWRGTRYSDPRIPATQPPFIDILHV